MKCRRVQILVAAVVLFVSVSPVMAVIEFKDGLTHDIDYRINDDVWVDYESPGLGTTLNILDGASRLDGVYGWEDSNINILGGSIDYHRSSGLWAYDSSQVTVSGGSIIYLEAFDSSQVAVSGGRTYWSWAYGSSQVTVTGGSMDYLYTYDSSQVAVSGGSISHDLFAHDSSQVTISGGSIGIVLLLSENAVLTIHGSDFTVDGVPFGYGELTSILGGDYWDEPTRHLTGILASGDLLDNDFYIGHSAKIVLVPEPASAVILGLGGFFLVLRRRRRQA